MPIQKVLNESKPVLVWTSEIELEAEVQLRNTARLPFVFKHVAVMPDVHLGIGATVGSVIASKGAICPAAVGVDIGCGMMAVKVDVDYRKAEDVAKKIRNSIQRSIPVGFGENHRIPESVHKWQGWSYWDYSTAQKDSALHKKAIKQMGSLGGGNHFIELCHEVDGADTSLWVMLHSGSRGTGNVLARRHIEEAKGIMQRYFIDLPDPDLAYFVEGTAEFDRYYKDLQWCQDYARENREEMMRRCLKDIAYAINDGNPLTVLQSVNCHHNYVDREHHYGENVLVTRKGAVRARQGDLGIIPGSMGTRSYIVEGLGNDRSFHSCSHGAGRRMSRTMARKTFTKDDFAAQTSGVECRKDEGVLDEIPGAYKDIDQVMANQDDLVSVKAVLKQFLCIKG